MKSVLFLSVFFISSVVSAQNYTDFTSEQYKAFIKEQLEVSIKQNNEINEKCIQASKAKELSKETIEALSKLNLNKSQLSGVLGYYAFKNQLDCIGPSQSIVLGFLNEAKKLNIKDDNQVLNEMKNILFDESFMIKYQYILSTIPKDKQDKISDLKELEKPFDALEIAKIKTQE